MNTTQDAELKPVPLAHGVVLCAIVNRLLIVGEVAGNASILADLLDYAEESGCSTVLFHTSRKGLLFRALDVTNARVQWTAPAIVGYVVEVKREGC